MSAAGRHYDARRILAGIAKELLGKEGAMVSALRNALLHQKARLEQLSAKVSALSPLAILERGYALVFDSSGALLKNAAQVSPGDRISARRKGTVAATMKTRPVSEQVWGGHSMSAAFDFLFISATKEQESRSTSTAKVTTSNFNGGGQECPRPKASSGM